MVPRVLPMEGAAGMRVSSFNSVEDAAAAIRRLGADEWSIPHMAAKMMHQCLLIPEVSLRGALILKQEALAKGAEAAYPRETIQLTLEKVPVLLAGTHAQLQRLARTLRMQPFGLRMVAERLEEFLRSSRGGDPAPTAIGDRVFHWGSRTHMMGIVNMTPDSFSGDGLGGATEAAIELGRKMVEAGADILDVGGESTRPGASPIGPEEQIRRVVPAIGALSGLGVPTSVDTRSAAVARAALQAGATMVNDISALTHDPAMADVVAEHGAVVCLMHMQGTPETMQTAPSYRDVVAEVSDYLSARAEYAVSAGIRRDRIVVDPGIGFGKSVEHNLDLMNQLDLVRAHCGFPLLVGPSRKSFIGKTLSVDVEHREWGTAAAVALAVVRGADVVRVHDVREMVQVARMADAMARRPRWTT